VSRDAPAAGTAGTRCICTACPLLCDDISLSPAGADRACDLGRAAFAACADADLTRTQSPVGNAAVTQAAALLVAARRVLVTGLRDATLEATLAACDLAEELAAAVDVGDPELATATGPTTARVGRVTAEWDELRDRADLVVFWNCDPRATHPRFVERFVLPPLADGRRRHTIAVGAAAVLPPGPHDLHVPLPADLSVEAARCLQLVLDGGRLADVVPPPLVAAATTIATAIRSASCVAFVTAAGGAVGLEGWSIARVVGGIAHSLPAFELPLGGYPGAAAVCTWRYGAAGGIDRADPMGGRFLPGEASATRLIERGEVDAVLAAGGLGHDVAAALAAVGPRLPVVRIAASPAAPTAHERSIVLRCADPLLTAGRMLRGDGRCVSIVPPRSSPLPSLRDLLVLVHRAVSAARLAAVGGRP